MVDRNRAFTIGPQLAKLTGAYPPPEDVFEAVAVGQREKAILARLWVSEGIPFAFRRCPVVYEEVRNALATRLEVDAKQISVAGSGRIGYSLAPTKWGEAYDEVMSDLDFFAVSEGLFERLREDFERWRDDYGRGEAEPRSARERRFWNANRDETRGTIRRGFIDSKRVPNRERYGVFSSMNRCLANLWAKPAAGRCRTATAEAVNVEVLQGLAVVRAPDDHQSGCGRGPARSGRARMRRIVQPAGAGARSAASDRGSCPHMIRVW